jgi:ATP-dependent Clp protease ATP-binding subunit ClpA
MNMFERFTRSARAAVVLAQEDAGELNAQEIGPEHLLVGALQSAGHDLSAMLGGYGLTADVIRARLVVGDGNDSFEADAKALRAIGIDLHAIRDGIARTFGPDAYDDALRKSGRRRRRRGHIPFTRSAKKVLELALREALAHEDSTIGCEHMVLGILRGGDKFTLSLITEHVSGPQLRESITSLLDEAA